MTLRYNPLNDPGLMVRPGDLYPINSIKEAPIVRYASACVDEGTRVTAKVYLVGSLRNPKIPQIAKELRTHSFDVFDDWHCPGPETDEFWQAYEKDRGRSYQEALDAPHAWNVFEFDKKHIDRADVVVLVMPAGRSAHLELGYAKGSGKKAYVLFEEEPERWDVMYRFADGVAMSVEELIGKLKGKL